MVASKAKPKAARGAVSSHALFKAMRQPRAALQGAALPIDLPLQAAPVDTARRAHDFYATGEPCAARALLAADGARIAALGGVFECAVGNGALAREFVAAGLPVVGADIVDRGWPDTIVQSYYDFEAAPARAIITNPPFCEINARDGHGRWLRHTLDLPGWDYCAFLLSWDWPAAVVNGLGAMLDASPFSYCYLMRWKIDFTGAGSPPQRNAWFVWDRAHVGPPEFRWLNRVDNRQETMNLGADL